MTEKGQCNSTWPI